MAPFLLVETLLNLNVARLDSREIFYTVQENDTPL